MKEYRGLTTGSHEQERREMTSTKTASTKEYREDQAEGQDLIPTSGSEEDNYSNSDDTLRTEQLHHACETHPHLSAYRARADTSHTMQPQTSAPRHESLCTISRMQESGVRAGLCMGSGVIGNATWSCTLQGKGHK